MSRSATVPKASAEPDDLVPLRDAAAELGFSPKTLWYWCRQGLVEHHLFKRPGEHRRGRVSISRSEIERLKDESRVQRVTTFRRPDEDPIPAKKTQPKGSKTAGGRSK
jgi:hypothetical protein